MADEEKQPRDAELPAGYDTNEPYADEELSSYPEWWQRNIREFRAHGMRPYLPPQFSDGENSTEVIDELEGTLGIDIEIRAVDPSLSDTWTVRVDGELCGEIERNRKPSGRTVYELTSTKFEALVENAVSERK